MNNKGFTLLEIMISLIILAIGLLALAGMQITSVKGNYASNNVAQATVLAKSQLEYLKDIDYSHAGLSAGTHSATGITVPTAFSLQYQVVENVAASTKTISVAVSWTDRVVHSTSLKTLRYR